MGIVRQRLCVRDCFKWAARLSSNSLVHSTKPALLATGCKASESIVREAWDVFVSWIHKWEDRRAVAAMVAGMFGVPEERVDQMLSLEKPRIARTSGGFAVGRMIVPQQGAVSEAELVAQATYAETGVAMRVLEAMAAAIVQNEPLLLVGETGTGKTTGIQFLASQVTHL